tara:strand:- start:1081 stop:1308 length:228 start_codon:yes stop_codon:yes gene_type:complete
MKLGTLVDNNELGLGLVTEELNENCCIVNWFEFPRLSPMVITYERYPKYPIKNLWLAPYEYGRVFILSEKNEKKS